MPDIWVVVPTCGRDTLTAAIDSTGIPRDRVVVIVTALNVDVPDGCRSIIDVGPINIHRWWNRGIALAESHGARFVAVINDDVLLDADSLPTLVDAMDGATLASPGAPVRMTDPFKHHPMTILGSCWVLDVTHGLRPDEAYRWWYGDNKLDWDARRHGEGIARASVTFEHLAPNHLTSESPDLQSLANLDAYTWAQAH